MSEAMLNWLQNYGFRICVPRILASKGLVDTFTISWKGAYI